jgi:hypothetical protein
MPLHFECPHMTLTLEEGDSQRRIAALISQALEKRKVEDEYYELRDLLVVTPFSWPAFIEWNRTFEGLCFEPRNWADVDALTIREDWQIAFERLRGVPITALRILLENPYPMPLSAFVKKFGPSALNELSNIGGIRLISETFDKLPHVPLEHLRGIQKRLGTKGGRSRAQAASKIKECATQETVEQLLLPEYREDLVLVDSPVSQVASDWLRQRERLADLYLQTLSRFLRSIQEIQTAMELGSGVFIDNVMAECPVCKPRVGHGIEIGKDEIPPFHPGCSCSLFPETLRKLVSR